MVRANIGGRSLACALLLATAMAEGAVAQKKDAFARRDTNGDGVITQQEWTASGERAVRRLDTNGDGGISRAEFVAFQKQRAARLSNRVFRRIEQRGATVIRLDTILRERRRARLTRFDANKDGRISKAELRTGLEQQATRRMGRLFKRFDRDGDGVISRQERQVMNDRRFARLDADQNGKLTRAELTAAQKRFRARAEQRRSDASAAAPKKPEQYRKP